VIQGKEVGVGIRMEWDGDLRFTGRNDNGAGVTIETGVAYGGSGKHPTPMELLLHALAGCAGIDLVTILNKMRVDLSEVVIEIEAKRRTEEPRYYEEIKIVYDLSGKGLTDKKAGRAAQLATEKYCSVGVMLREKARITYEVRIR
jgi:putative redox protein